MTKRKTKWTWPLVWLELRRAVGITFLGLAQRAWPNSTSEDKMFHEGVRSIARTLQNEFGRGNNA